MAMPGSMRTCLRRLVAGLALKGKGGMSFRGYFQNGYVTRDLDRALDLVASQFGLGDFSRMDLELPLITPNGAKTACLRVATAWADRLQLELIEPVSGHVDHYLRVLPEDVADATPRFHHVAVRRESEQEMRRDVARLGLPVVFETEGAGIHCMFVDARPHLGHHLELVCASPDGWDTLGWPRD